MRVVLSAPQKNKSRPHSLVASTSAVGMESLQRRSGAYQYVLLTTRKNNQKLECLALFHRKCSQLSSMRTFSKPQRPVLVLSIELSIRLLLCQYGMFLLVVCEGPYEPVHPHELYDRRWQAHCGEVQNTRRCAPESESPSFAMCPTWFPILTVTQAFSIFSANFGRVAQLVRALP